MAKDLSYYLNKTKAGAETAPAANTKKTSTSGSGGLSYYLAKNRNTPSYASALGKTQGLYAQALQDKRDAPFWEKVKNILGGTASGAGKTYAADMANAYATMGQSLAEMNRISPIVGTMTTPADALWSRAEQQAAQEKVYSDVQKWSDKVSEEGQKDIERAKSYTGKVGDTLIGAGVALGQMGADAAANLLLPGAGTALMAGRVFGGNARGARQEGAGLMQQSLYGAGGAAASVLSGKLFGGAMGAYGKGTTDDLVEAVVSRATGSAAGRNLLRAVIKANGEGVEEVIEELVDPALQVIYKGNLAENYRDMDWGQVLESYIIGVISGGAAEAVSMTAGQYKAANAILDDPGVQEAVEGFWKRTAENGTLSRAAREQFRTMADTMEKAKTEQNRTKAVENETRRIMRQTGMDEAYARAIAERRYGGEESAIAGERDGGQTAGRMSIEVNPTTGQRYVKADRTVLSGDDPAQWGKQLERYINEQIRKGEDVTFVTEDGHTLVLTERTAYKMADRHIPGKAENLADEDYRRKENAAGHIDELAQVARFDGYKPDEGGRHQNDIGEDGFNYFYAYFMDGDGKYYRVPLSAGINSDSETAYSIGNIRERTLRTGRGSSAQRVQSASDFSGAQNGAKRSDGIIRTANGNSQGEKTNMQIAYEQAMKRKGENNGKALLDGGQGNGADGIGAGGPAGVFSEAAGEPAAIEPGDQGEAGRGTENPESADLREVSPEELGITGAQNPVMLIDAERAGGSIADAADTVRSVGMEPVAFRGELRVGNASVNGYIEDGRIFFRTDAVDSQGREITAEQIVEHELFHAAAETDPQLVEDVKEVVRERMTEAEFDAMMADYETAYSKVQDFSDWTAEQIAEYLYQEIAADAYAGLNEFNDAPATVEAARAAAPQVGQARTDRSRAETRGPTTKNAPRFSLVVYDQNQKDNWSKSKKIVVYENERQLLDFVNRAKTDKTFVSKMYFGKVDPVLAGEIRNATGFEMEGLNVTLRADNVRKIFKDHGTEKTEAPRGQRAITDADFALIPAVIGDPDSINESEYNGRPAVEFKKLINGSNVTVFAVDSGASSLDLFVQTMYAGKQKGSIANTANASALTQTPATPVGIASTNNVSQTEAESNRNLPRASVEVSGPAEQLTPQEQTLVNDHKLELKAPDGRKVTVRIRERDTGGWDFRVDTKGEKTVFSSRTYRSAQEAAREAVRIGEQYAMPAPTRTQNALNEAADEAAEAGVERESPPPRGRYSEKDMEREEDRKRTLVEADAPWGTGDEMRQNDAQAQAAADSFADERAEKAAQEDLEQAFADYANVLHDQLPVRDKESAEKKVTSEVKARKPATAREKWRSLVRTIVNAGDTIHRIGRETGNKALDGYYFRALAARQAGTEWITGKRHDLMGRATGKGLNEIFSPIRAKGQDYYEQFQLYLYHMLNIDRMSRDYEAEAREAQAEVTRLENIEPAISRLSPETLKRIADSYSMDAQFARDYIEAVEKRNWTEKRKAKPVFGFDVTADDSRAAVERLLEKHPEFEELAQDVYDYSNDLLQYRVDAGLIQQKDKEFLQRMYPHYVPTFRAVTKDDAKVLHKGGISVSKAIGRATGSDEKLLPLHVSLARQAMTVTKNGTINRLGNALLETRDANKETMAEYILDVQEAENSFNEDTFDDEEVVEPREENVITIIENGKRYDVKLDKGLTDAFKAFEPDRWAGKEIAQASRKMVDVFKKLVTAWNPLFTVRNILRDVQDAMLYSKDLTAWGKNLPLAYSEIFREGKYWQMYKGLGGNYASIFDYTTGEARADKGGISGAIEKANRIVEAAPRLAEFMAIVKKAEARNRKAAGLPETPTLAGAYIPSRAELEAKPDMRIVGIRSPEKKNGPSPKETGFKDSPEAMEMYKAPVVNRDTGARIFITKGTFSHTFSNDGSDRLALARHLPEVIENAVLTYGEDSRSSPGDHSTGVFTLFGAVRTKRGVQPVKLKVKEYLSTGHALPQNVQNWLDKNGEQATYAAAYDGKVLLLESIEKEDASSYNSAATKTRDEPAVHYPSASSTIKIAELLALVKGDAAKYIPRKGEGGRNRMITEADLMEAFEAAQDITTNFGRSGSLGGMLNKYFVPFLNPSIQGADKFIRNLSERKGAKAWAQLVVRAAALGIAPAIINGMLHRADDDWEEEWDDISEVTKANYYLFKVRDGVWIKIPRGRALAVLSTAGVAAEEAMKGNDIDPADFLEVITTNLAPQNPLEANIFKAWFDADLFNADSRGKTWYGGTIETERMQSYRPGERYDESTDIVSKWIGDKLNLSPAKINYLIDQYSGVVGDMLLPVLTPQAERDPLSKAFTIDTVTNNETTGEYYDLLDELKWDMNGGDIAAGTTYRYMSHVNEAVSDYYADIREIEADPELTNREKRELTRELYRDLVEYQKEILATEEKYRLAAEEYYDDHPELDHEDKDAVRVYMEEYNAQQSDEKYYKDEDAIASLMEAIVYREVNREVLGAEYALETYSESVYEKAQEANKSAGVSYDTYYEFYFGTKDMHADRDENGNSISGTKKAKVLGFIAAMDIPDEQKDALAVAAGYKTGAWKSYTDGKTGGSSGGRGGRSRSKKTKALTIKNTLTRPVGISYDRSMSIAARTPAETSAYEGIQKVTSQIRKKNPWWALPTGNPEIDEERPAAARYFATGEW